MCTMTRRQATCRMSQSERHLKLIIDQLFGQPSNENRIDEVHERKE